MYKQQIAHFQKNDEACQKELERVRLKEIKFKEVEKELRSRESDIQVKIISFHKEVEQLRQLQQVEDREKELESKVEELEITIEILNDKVADHMEKEEEYQETIEVL